MRVQKLNQQDYKKQKKWKMFLLTATSSLRFSFNHFKELATCGAIEEFFYKQIDDAVDS